MVFIPPSRLTSSSSSLQGIVKASFVSALASSVGSPVIGGQKLSLTCNFTSKITPKSDKYRANERRTKLAWVIPSAADII